MLMVKMYALLLPICFQVAPKSPQQLFSYAGAVSVEFLSTCTGASCAQSVTAMYYSYAHAHPHYISTRR